MTTSSTPAPVSPSAPPSSHAIAQGPGHARTPLRMLIWAALGVVFGDVGTSPLYAMSETVSSHLMATRGLQDKVTMELGQYYGRDEVFGWTSLFFWAIAIVVTIKYVVLIMRADNHGEGGMFAILALLKSKAASAFSPRAMFVVVAMAVLGSGLILGDGVITPSLSIMSAWEGLEVVTHRWSRYIPWLSVATIVGLFWIQRFGTAKVGAIFAPVMVVWFAALAIMGGVSFAHHPEIISAVNPWCAVKYMAAFPKATLYVIGSVDLCITGCEALFADMGHFGRPAVRRAWFFIVWPALLINYLGQGARMLDPAPIVDGNVFYALVPSSAVFVYPLVMVSWLATIIASQALISGAFSLVSQAVQLGLFPRVNVVHTNEHVEGQIYIPEVNWAYMILCIVLVLAFRSSHNLAPAYGLAVTGTMGFTTVLFYLVAVHVWHWKRWLVAPLCLVLVFIDIAFFLSNATQFMEGGYVTIAVALVLAFMMLTWRKGREALGNVLRGAALPLETFMKQAQESPAPRLKGTAVFMTGNPGAPPSLVQFFRHTKTLHEQVLFLTVQTRHEPQVPEAERITEVRDLGLGFYTAKVAFGFMESPDIPRTIGRLAEHGFHADPGDVSFFLGRESLVFTGASKMSLPRKVFFKFLSQNAIAASTFFKLPPERVVELGMQVEI